jgi:uracil-DNA glycosylase
VAWFEPAASGSGKDRPLLPAALHDHALVDPDARRLGLLGHGEALRFGPAATRDMAPAEDEVEEFWKTYYASTFNPARLKLKTMQGEMPKAYWKNLPEAALIPELDGGVVRFGPRAMVNTPVSSDPNTRFSRAMAPDLHAARPEADSPPKTLDEVASVAFRPAAAAPCTATRPRACAARGPRRRG